MSWKEFLEEVAAGKKFHSGEDREWPISKLTPAETKVLIEILSTPDGGPLPQQDVATKLFIDVKTVKSHVDRIYDKFRVDKGGSRITKLRKKLRAEFKPSSAEETLTTQTPTSTSQIDWHTACKELLDIQKQQLTSSPIRGGNAKDLDRVHVPLGLVERKEKRPPKFDREQEFSPDRGSEAYHQIETQRIEHDAFLTAVHDRQPGEHLVILGEPGAGKTTLLTKVWESLLKNVDVGEDIIVAWVPLAEVKDGNLEEYLHNTWLKQVCKPREKDAYWATFEELVDARRVWLLLDGADEMGGDALMKIETILIKEKWARSTIRAIVTCRLNLWDGSPNRLNSSPNFQIYRTLDFKYISPAGDEVERFIENWFQEAPETGKKLRSTLDATGKERIKDLAQNPLRLTLLCDIWEEKQELPDTQFQLYEQFVECVYKHNERKFSTAVALKNELDRAMGDLAKQGINKPTLRFRFSDRELTARLPDLQHRKHLEDLGWLNCVGVDENNKNVYAFFHPTFQEYFAARSIDDWDYFLPRAHLDRPVNCRGEDKPTYRAFEQEWRQVILLWIGRRDEVVTDEFKEEFIEKLTDFREQEGEFYYYRAYCMAAICVGEFRSSRQIEEIIRQIIKWAFGYFKTETQKWMTYLDSISSLARETIAFTCRRYAIAALITLMQDPQLDNYNYQHHLVAETLGQIAIGNKEVIAALITLMQDPQLDNYLRSHVVETLSQIAVSNKEAISALVTLVQDPQLDNYLRSRVAKTLGEIDVGNKEAITALVTLVRDPQLDYYLRSRVAEALGEIAVGNKEAITAFVTLVEDSRLDAVLSFYVTKALGEIDVGNKEVIGALVTLVEDPQLSNYLRSHVAEALGEIAVGNKEAITALVTLAQDLQLDDDLSLFVADALGRILPKKTGSAAILQLKNSVTNAVYESNYGVYKSCFKILFQCAQTLSYPEFHTAWHQTHLPTNPFTPQNLDNN